MAESGTTLFVGDFGGSGIETFTSLAEFDASPDAASASAEGQAQLALFFINGGQRALTLSVASSDATTISNAIAAELSADINIEFVAVPPAAALAPTDAALVYGAALQFARAHKAMLLVDPPASANPVSISDLSAWKGSVSIDDPNAALFAPALNFSGLAAPIPPCGAVAGVAARVARARGVWKSPTENITGATLTQNYTTADSELANPAGINLIRFFDGRGTRIWGARTLSSNPEWRYIATRRLALLIDKSLTAGLSWVGQRPNEDATWREVRSRIEDFMQELFRQGALQGAKAEEAFFVRCDRSTMTQTDIDNRRLIVQLGFAPVRPAEFIILRFQFETA
jgi:hypothetical protein